VELQAGLVHGARDALQLHVHLVAASFGGRLLQLGGEVVFLQLLPCLFEHSELLHASLQVVDGPAEKALAAHSRQLRLLPLRLVNGGLRARLFLLVFVANHTEHLHCTFHVHQNL